MKKPTRFNFAGRDGQTVAAFRWAPPGTPRAIIQITHGLAEYVRRYQHVADALTAKGFTVQGQDHRAHGATAGSEERLGKLGAEGWRELVHDIGVLAQHGRKTWPGVPLFLLSHSMGSFATQQFLLDGSHQVDGVVLTGTTLLDMLEPSLNLDAPLDLATFNAGIPHPRNGYDWLSRDPGAVDAYIGDPYCGVGVDVEGAKAMFAGGRAIADAQRMAKVRANLPLHIAVGAADPVSGGNGALAQVLLQRYRDAGLQDVTLRVYEGARHEILNETNGDAIIADIIQWYEHVLARRE